MQKTVLICGQQIPISETTMAKMNKHTVFYSQGIDWLLEHDSKGKLEQVLIDDVCDALRNDFHNAIKHLPDDQHDLLTEEFSGCDIDDWWDDLLEVSQ